MQASKENISKTFLNVMNYRLKDINNKNNDENNKALINKTKHQIESLNSRSFIMNQEKKIDV